MKISFMINQYRERILNILFGKTSWVNNTEIIGCFYNKLLVMNALF